MTGCSMQSHTKSSTRPEPPPLDEELPDERELPDDRELPDEREPPENELPPPGRASADATINTSASATRLTTASSGHRVRRNKRRRSSVGRAGVVLMRPRREAR